MDLSTPLNATKRFLITHLEKRDIEGALSILAENIAWVGTGESETVQGKESVRRLISEEIAQTPLGYHVEFLQMSVAEGCDSCAAVTGKIRVTDKERGSIFDCRLSSVCVKENGSFRIAALHKSFSAITQENGEFSPISFSEEQLRKIKDNFFDLSVPAGLTCCEISADMQITYANTYILNLLGYQSFKELMSETSGSFRDIVSTAEDIETLIEEAKRIKENESKMFTYRLRAKDGHDIWVRDCSRRYSEENGKEFLLCYCTDVSDLLKMQKDLQLLSNNIPGGLAVYEYTPEGINAKYLSDGIFKVIGHPKEEYLARSKKEYDYILFEEDKPILREQIKRLIEKDIDIDCTYRVNSKCSGYRWINLRATAFERDGDRVVINALISDVTYAKEAEETLRARDEEYRVAITHCGKTVCLHDLATGTLTMPDDYAAKHGLKPILEDAHNVICSSLTHDEKVKESYNNFYNKIVSGEKSGTLEMPIILKDGSQCWEQLKFVNIFDRDGKPLKAIVTVEDTTLQHKINDENKNIRESERLLRIVAAHSNRSIMRYEVASKTTYTDEQTAAAYNLPAVAANIPESFIEKGIVLPESIDEYRKIYEDISAGKPDGCAKIHMAAFNGKPHWLDFKYSVIETENGKASTVAISFSDITDTHEKELAYELYRQTIESNNRRGREIVFFETDVTQNTVEKTGGRLLPINFINHSNRKEHLSYVAENFIENKEERQKFMSVFSRENIITMYQDGTRSIQNSWHTLFPNGEHRWLQTEIKLIEDPYSHNIKSYTIVTDITAEKKAALKAQKQAETDGMTGLYNKTTTETLVRKQLAADKGRPCAIIVADLDDLKNINDNLGHAQGDIAIKGFARVLSSHFCSTDIIGRIGGDEFMVFIDGAVGGSKLSSQMTELIRKFAALRIGENSDIAVHGSIGIVTSITGRETFDELYKKADKALYHTKRNGKNDYAFYTPQMELASYKHTGHGELSLQYADTFDRAELNRLLYALSSFFPLIFSANISQNSYYIMQSSGFASQSCLKGGDFDEIINSGAETYHREDRKAFLGKFSRESLLKAYERGEQSVCFKGRELGDDGKYRWIRSDAAFISSKGNDDIQLIIMAREVDSEHREELAKLRLEKLLELAVSYIFEYICIIYPENNEYEIYASDGKNNLGIPHVGNFDNITQEIGQKYLPAEEMKEFFEKAKIKTVLEEMKEHRHYRYTYTFSNETREVDFYFYEPTETELLMTVRKISG